ncbi:MAG: cyclic nucleotide-binding domain-containing protein [Kofleriaceae bacterium]
MRDPHQLREEAAAAVARGNFGDALALYQELETLEPMAAAWPKRVGETYRRMGDVAAAVSAFERAVDKYAHDGLLVQAIAVCKLILQLDANRTATATRLAELATPQPAEARTRTKRPTIGALIKEPIVERTKRVTLPPGAALDAIPLAMVVPDSHRVSSGVAVLDFDEVEIEVVDPRRMALLKTPIFAALPTDTLEAVIEHLDLKELYNGEELFHEGDRGTTMYVISEGEVEVTAAGQPLASLHAGEFFGEIALVTDLPRSATVRAKGKVELLSLDRAALVEANLVNALLHFVRDRLVDRVTRTAPLFRPFSDDERTQLASRFEFIEVDPDTTLITEGVKSDGLYVMLAGRADVTREAHVATLASGDVFGEMSLMANRGSTATVRATTRLLALRLPASVFQELIMTYPQVLEFLSELQQGRSRLRMAEDFLDLHVTLV